MLFLGLLYGFTTISMVSIQKIWKLILTKRKLSYQMSAQELVRYGIAAQLNYKMAKHGLFKLGRFENYNKKICSLNYNSLLVQ